MPSDFRLVDASLLPAPKDGFKWEFEDFRLVPASPGTFRWNVGDILDSVHQAYTVEIVMRSVSWTAGLLGDTALTLRFEDPLSHRISRDGALSFYGYSMSSERAPNGSIFTIGESEYLAEFSDSDEAMHGGLVHYMVSGLSQFCIEVITNEPPVVTTHEVEETRFMKIS
jgi:hypothetical protein